MRISLLSLFIQKNPSTFFFFYHGIDVLRMIYHFKWQAQCRACLVLWPSTCLG